MRLFIAREQAGEDHEMLFVLGISIGFLLQQCGERLLVVRVRRRSDKSPNTWWAW